MTVITAYILYNWSWGNVRMPSRRPVY